MSDSMNTRMSTRVMVTSTVATTFYPTGVPMGFVDGTGVGKGSSSSRSTSQSASYFDTAYTLAQGTAAQNRGRNAKIAIIRSIEVLVLSAAAGTLSLTTHDGVVIVPASLADAVLRRIEFGPDGLPVIGGFALVTTGATGAICAVVYEIQEV